jgi:hypothetical protein
MSRSNRTLTEHNQDRRTWVFEALGIEDAPIDPTATSGDRSRRSDRDRFPHGTISSAAKGWSFRGIR